jgi:hypothetical protein
MSTKNDAQKPVTAQTAKVEKRLDAIGWGLFFIWIGVALLAQLGWGVGLLGVGVLALGGQAARFWSGLKMDGFGIGFGALLVVGGICHLLDIRHGLTPVICVAAGLALVISALVNRAKNHDTGSSSVA